MSSYTRKHRVTNTLKASLTRRVREHMETHARPSWADERTVRLSSSGAAAGQRGSSLSESSACFALFEQTAAAQEKMSLITISEQLFLPRVWNLKGEQRDTLMSSQNCNCKGEFFIQSLVESSKVHSLHTWTALREILHFLLLYSEFTAVVTGCCADHDSTCKTYDELVEYDALNNRSS